MQAGDTKTFLCPSDGDAGEPFTPAVLKSQDPAASSISDVQNRSQLSYAFQYQGPVAGTAAGTTVAGWNTNLKDDPKMVILADTSPALKAQNLSAILTNSQANRDAHRFEFASSTASATFPTGKAFYDALNGVKNITWDAAKAQATYSLNNPRDQQDLNSPNHRGEGQNFLRLDGSGDFAGDPWAGAYKDNIWTIQDPSYYDDAATAAKDTNCLIARMKGLFDAAGTAGAGGTFATYDTVTLMPNWVLRPESKTTFPDSFLVP
jgi:hypothetical protein